MTENEAKEILNRIAIRNVFCTLEEESLKAFEIAEIALEEIQQYRAFGTLEEVKNAYIKGYNQGTIDRAEEITHAREYGYDKAIDEFAEKMKDANTTNAFVLYQADEIDLAEFISLAVDEIAQQLKAEKE